MNPRDEVSSADSYTACAALGKASLTATRTRSMEGKVSRNQRLVAIGVVAAVTGMGASLASANMVYDAASNFNGTRGGTTGVWQYGQISAAGRNFTELAYNGSWAFEGPGTVLVGSSVMHTGGYFTGVHANLRFVAPTAGTYTATFRARLLDAGNNPYVVSGSPDFRRDGVRMWLNTTYRDLQTWDQATLAQSFEFQTVTQTFALEAGGTIDFSIDPNGARGFEYGAQSSYLGYNIYDSTSYMASVEMIPAPGAAALLGVGGLLGFRRRR
jgi:hypothetical protein